MFRKTIGLAFVIVMVFLLSGTCLAEKILDNMNTTQEVIDKYFAGRTLDPVEGIWVQSEGNVLAILKSSIVKSTNPKYQNSDYFGLSIGGKYAGHFQLLLNKTQYSFAFNGRGYEDNYKGSWKLLTPTLLQYDGIVTGFTINGVFANPCQSFMRIYPAP